MSIREWSPVGQPTVYYMGRYWFPTVWVLYIGSERRVRHFQRACHCNFTPPFLSYR